MTTDQGGGARGWTTRLGAVVDRFLPPALLEGPSDAARRARLSVIFAWVSAAFFLAAAAGQAAGHNGAAALVDGFCALLNLLAPLVIRRTGRVAAVTHGVLAVVYCAVVALALLVRGAGLNGATLVLTLIPLFATLIIGVRAGAAWAFASLISGVALGLLGRAELITDHLPAPTRLLNDHIVLATLTLVLFSVATLFEIRKDEALRHISELETQRREAELGELRAHTEAQLAEADRFASLGRIAAATAHEINNPLTFIIGNIELLAEGAADRGDADDRESLQDALDGARRIQRIVKDMSASARAGSDAITDVVITDVIAAAHKMAEPHITPRARVRMTAEPVPPVVGNEARLVQVFLNLLVNAAQSIPEGRAADHEIAIEIRSHDHRVIVEVRDSGNVGAKDPRTDAGEASTPERIGEGAGLGLALSEAIVRSVGGTLELTSGPGCAVTRVTLVARPAEGKAEGASTITKPGERGAPLQILVIDDEPLVASTIARLLAPHTVTIAHSGRQALARLDEGTTFDLVFCDLMMPELTGMDVFEQLQASNPPLSERIVFMTGGTFTERAGKFRAAVSNTFLEKPFDRRRILEIVDAQIREANAAKREPRPARA